uniref:Restricted tev movement 3 n=1 Tax=Arabidopsis thaliana TaxID=3702 RepID=D5K235_ARATH|nr:restricted tev movement 3 [Arabidopsis thaliana]
MGKQYDKKITWTIKNFASLPSDLIYSDHFVVGGCKWHLRAYPKGYNNANSLSLFLGVGVGVAVPTSLPSGWRRHTKFRLTLINQLSDKLSQSKLTELEQWFDEKATNWGLSSMCPLNEIHAKDSGFLLNGELKIVVEIKVLQTIGKLDVTEETSTITETVDVNGFQLLPSQAKSVSRMFEKHPELASDLRPKNPNLRTGYMSLLLSLIETPSQLPQQMSKDDLLDAYDALGSMRDAGFKLDWLEKKLYEVSEKKENEEASETGLKEMEEELKDMKQKCLEMEALVEKEKAKVSTAKAPISFDDIV